MTHMAEPILNHNSSLLKVLIVDDSRALQQRLASMLRKVEGLKVVGQAVGVAEANKAIEELHPDLVVLDLQLGDGSGLDVLRETKKNSPEIKFVIFTNQSELQYRQRCTVLGAEYFLCKSTGARSLIAITESLIAREGKLDDCPRKPEF